MSHRLRKIWLISHRWLGLTVGMLFVLTGVSGSFLVFQHAIDEWLNPELLVTEGHGSVRPLREIVTAAERANPDRSAKMQFVDLPRELHGVWTFWFQNKSQTGGIFTQVYMDPSTAQVTGHRVRGEGLVGWVYSLHTELLAGKSGATIVGIVGIMLLISVCSGIVLWWPLLKNSWRTAFCLRSGRRFTYDLHKTTGIISAAFLLVTAFTGVYLVFPTWIKPCIGAILPETAPPTGLRSKSAGGQARIDADQAIAIAQKTFPDGECKRLHFPSGPEGVYIVRVRQPGEVRRSSGNSRVWIDQYSGEVLAVRDWYNRTTADTVLAWQFPLHNGEAFGLSGRWLVLATGLTLGMLYVTGCLMWWRKHLSRKRQRRHIVTLNQPKDPAPQESTTSNG